MTSTGDRHHAEAVTATAATGRPPIDFLDLPGRGPGRIFFLFY